MWICVSETCLRARETVIMEYHWLDNALLLSHITSSLSSNSYLQPLWNVLIQTILFRPTGIMACWEASMILRDDVHAITNLPICSRALTPVILTIGYLLRATVCHQVICIFLPTGVVNFTWVWFQPPWPQATTKPAWDQVTLLCFTFSWRLFQLSMPQVIATPVPTWRHLIGHTALAKT
jgi:hypothetical protein